MDRIAADRAAQGRSELVLMKRLGFCREEISRIERAISQEIVGVTVERVCSRLGDDGSRCAAGFSVFRGCVGGQNTKFVHGVNGSAQGKTAIHAVDVAHPIQKIVVGFRRLTIHGVGLTATGNTASLRKTKRHRCNTRLKKA